MGYIYTKSGKLAKRLYFGAVLLFEGLYYTFKNRVLADGGTFVENELPTISQDAKLVLTPNAYKAGKLYSAVPNDGTGDFTVDRNSTATYIGQDGLIKTALANVPRIDYSSGEVVVLREAQSINLWLQSNNFLTSPNTTARSSITANQAISPDGTNNAFKLNDSTDNNTHLLYQSISTTIGQTYTISVFLKKGEVNYGFLAQNNSLNETCFFNLNTGAILNMGVNIISAKIESIDSFWFKCSIVFSANLTNYLVRVGTSVDGIAHTYTGTGSQGIYAYGAQLELGSAATSYIPTTTASVTRLADDISVTTPAGVSSITETIDGIDQTPISTIPATYSLPVGNINKVKML